MNRENKKRQNIHNFMNAYEVSAYLSLPISTVYDLTKNGRIKATRAGKKIRYKEDDIEYYLQYGIPASSRYPLYESGESLNNPTGKKRLYPRINCSLSCIINVHIPDEKRLSFTSRILNISIGGIFIENHTQDNLFNQIKNDDPIKLFFDLEGNNNLGANGRVLRISDKGMAVKFRNLYQNTKELIEEL